MRVGRAPPCPLRIRARPITADDVHARMRGQPLGEGVGGPVGEEIDGAVAFEVFLGLLSSDAQRRLN